MRSEPHADAGPASQNGDSGRILLERVMASSEFSRSPRLRQLLEYLCEKSLADPGTTLSEEQIGVEVFGRPRGYDTGSDTIVRVQVSQLRKKLEHYFLSEGAAEPVVIDLLKRLYTPVFRVRDQVPPGKENAEQVLERSRWRVVSVCLAVLLVVCSGLAGWLAFQNSQLRGRVSPSQGRTPYRDHFWSQVFRSGRETRLIPSDGNAMMLCDFLGRPLTPAEYVGSGYPNALIDSQVREPSTRAVLKSIMENFLTNLPDLPAASQLSLIAASHGGRLNIVFARDFRYQPQTPDNLILLGHRKANPWVALFEERMNFRYEFEPKGYQAAIVNLAPMPGEEVRYPVKWGVQTYALIAHLRKPVGEGTVLMLEGTDVTAVAAGCDLLTDETRIQRLYQRLGLRPTGPVPDFEILLRAKQLRSSLRDYEMVAHRVHER
jgi:hypothetical protein